jgi:hypothetical protein
MFQVLHLSFFMLQVLYLDVLKVDWLLHMRYEWEAGGGASSPHVSARRMRRGPLHECGWRMRDRGTFGRDGPACGHSKMDCNRARPFRSPGAMCLEIVWHGKGIGPCLQFLCPWELIRFIIFVVAFHTLWQRACPPRRTVTDTIVFLAIWWHEDLKSSTCSTYRCSLVMVGSHGFFYCLK